MPMWCPGSSKVLRLFPSVIIHYNHYIAEYPLTPLESVYDLNGIVLIWKTAVGRSLASACTVAFMPMAAKAPRIIPHGTKRNCKMKSATFQRYGAVCGRRGSGQGGSVLVRLSQLSGHQGRCWLVILGGTSCLSTHTRPGRKKMRWVSW